MQASATRRVTRSPLAFVLIRPRRSPSLRNCHCAAVSVAGLTPRQNEVLGKLLQGLPNKLIARELNA